MKRADGLAETTCFHVSLPLPSRSQRLIIRTSPQPANVLASDRRTDSSRDRTSPAASAQNISRRALLLSAAAAALTSLQPHSASAYSSPYRPGQKTEQNLPQRLYDKPADATVKTASGLRYFDLAPGTGAEAQDGDTVFVYYTSRLAGLNGIKIQSTFDDPSSPPFIFRVGAPDVVPGVSEAVRGMRVGGKRRALLPPDISYKSPDMKPAVTEFFARRRLLSVLETNRDATIAFEYVVS